jgi:predicted MFS family arabinose efflux permease
MTPRRLKTLYFSLTACNTIASVYFFNYLVFFLRDHFGFQNSGNLWIAALHGFIYIFAAWQCGKFAQRRGFLTSLKLGFGGLAALMFLGGIFTSLPGILFVVVGYSVVLLFTWPALEALVSENENRAGVQQMVGIYNCTWAAAAAFAYFTGGKLYDWSHKGAVFWIPAGIFLFQIIFVLYITRRAAGIPPSEVKPVEAVPHHPEAAAFRQPVSPKTFLKMAWWSSPFAYVAINTLLAVMPGVAEKLELSPTRVGLFCSIWFFGRFAAFVLLWKWSGWHYRFRWLLSAFLLLIVSFLVILLAPKLWMILLAQVFFGGATGVIYYSSLFYSMDAADTKAEHGGLHEAAIGVGIFAGPAVGAATLHLLPDEFDAGTTAVMAVGILLLCGLVGLIWLRVRNLPE